MSLVDSLDSDVISSFHLRRVLGGSLHSQSFYFLLHSENDLKRHHLDLLCALGCSFSVSGVSQSVLITQWPHYISRLPSGSAEMSCYQNDTDYDYMYWYRQLRGGEIQLVGYLVAGSANYEAGFQSGFEAAKSQEKQWSLKIASVQREDEAVYLCAASLHSACDTGTEAYFGKGTKLTVLGKSDLLSLSEPEYDVKPPVVKVLGPSSRECRNLKDNERRKTLLCVASDFYPDHVSVSWRVGGQEVSRGVATDNAALRQGENYKITSRLRVSAEDWFKPETEFESEQLRAEENQRLLHVNKSENIVTFL
uniref:Ig-like domain-containing protein n=1 Tax=Scophthalmus maximus TaxID=52904 RepID=A0A8D3CFB0_SCOMX